MRYQRMYVTDLQISENDENIIIHGFTVKLSSQKTGFGYRLFFVCPQCDKRIEMLRYSPLSNELYCRHCEGFKGNIYKYRTYLYDKYGAKLINEKIKKEL